MSVSFGGFNSNAVTFKATEKIENGCAVKISESNTVTPCADGDVFCGFALDGAKEGTPVNFETIKNIDAAVNKNISVTCAFSLYNTLRLIKLKNVYVI